MMKIQINGAVVFAEPAEGAALLRLLSGGGVAPRKTTTRQKKNLVKKTRRRRRSGVTGPTDIEAAVAPYLTELERDQSLPMVNGCRLFGAREAIRLLGRDTGIRATQDTMRDALNRLVTAGKLQIVRQGGRNRGGRNVYGVSVAT